jgi:hypothetical protein
MAETTSEGLASVRRLRQTIWKVEVTGMQFRKIVERCIRESQPGANFTLGDLPVYLWVQESKVNQDDLSEAEVLTDGCDGPAFTAIVFEEPVG